MAGKDVDPEESPDGSALGVSSVELNNSSPDPTQTNS